MKLKPDYVLREVAGSWVVLPLAENVLNFNGMLSLNESGVLLWKEMEAGVNKEKLIAALTDHYEVSTHQAASDVDDFVKKLIQTGCIETD